MGASSSKTESTSETDMLTSAYNSCGSANSTNIVTLSGIKFYPPADCKEDPEFTIGQTATVDATCLLSSLQDSAAQTASTLDSDAQAGLGFSTSSDVSKTKTSISEYTTNQCADVSSTNMADITDTEIRSCKFEVVQNATANQSCQINATQSAISDIATQESSSATGGSIFGDLFGNTNVTAIIIAIILIMLVVGGGYYFYKKSSNSSNSSNSSDNSNKSNNSNNSNKSKESGTNNDTSESIGSRDLSVGVSTNDEEIDPNDLKGGQIGGLFNIIQSATKGRVSFEKSMKSNKSWLILGLILLILMVIYLFKKSNVKVKNYNNNNNKSTNKKSVKYNHNPRNKKSSTLTNTNTNNKINGYLSNYTKNLSLIKNCQIPNEKNQNNTYDSNVLESYYKLLLNQ